MLWKIWSWSWSSNTLATWWEEPTHWKRLWCWERLRVGGEGGNRGWNGWMASPAQWTWVWANFRDSEGQGSLSCCSPWDHRVRHVQLATEQQQSNHLIHPMIQPISDHHIIIYLIYTAGQFWYVCRRTQIRKKWSVTNYNDHVLSHLVMSNSLQPHGL